MIALKSNKIITPNGLFDGYVVIENDKIVDLTSVEPKNAEIYDYTGKYVSPGFIETHTHGCGGYPFIDCTESDVVNGVNCHFNYGVTSICPTVTSGPFENMKKAVLAIEKAMSNKDTKPNILGAHLEGPYFSLSQAGAQCPDFITPPKKEDYIPLIEEKGSIIKRWSYAPERDENGEFCKYLVEHNIIASAAHTDAIGSDMEVAVRNGCNLVTHLYSGTSTITREFGFRRLGVIECAYLYDELNAEIIADGKHLPPELIKLILKLKGTDKVILTTDSLAVCGTDVKEGVMSGTEFIIEEGVCRLKDRSAFAGSIATADRLVRVLKDEVGVSIEEAVKMLTLNPAKLLKVNKGEIAVGKDADVIVFDDDINVESIFVGGIKKK